MSFTGELRPYQVRPVERMVDRGLFLLTAGVGTGKTPMTIAALEELREEFGEEFCGQVICAGGLKTQWRDQILAFTCTACCGRDLTDPNHPDHDAAHRHVGTSSVVVIDGTPDKRMELYKRTLAEEPQYVIVGYDQVVDDHNMVEQLPQMFVVLDEITTIKTPTALITEAIRATYPDAPFRYGLTGTPMENGRPEELFQIMTWVDDSVLGRPDLFDKTFCKRNKYGTVEEYMNLPLFFEMMQDCSASISPDDPDVAPYMPTMEAPRRVLVEFDVESARVYNVIAVDLLEDLAEAARSAKNSTFDLFAHYAGDSAAGEQQGRIMSKISCMRMLCAHPDQLIGSAETYLEQTALKEKLDAELEQHEALHDYHDAADCPSPPHPRGWPTVTRTRNKKKVKVPKPFDGSAYAAYLLQEGELDGLDETPKLDEVCFDTDEVLAGDCKCCRDVERPDITNKIVVFSYHKLALRILERRYGSVAVRYDGDMPLKQRNANKLQFQRDPATRLFLSSDAGGYGVDLPQANHLWNVDVPFTAGGVVQRNARIRRANLDYHDAVHVRNYLIEGSLEEYYADITAGKHLVSEAVRTGLGTKKGSIKVTADTLGSFLRENTV